MKKIIRLGLFVVIATALLGIVSCDDSSSTGPEEESITFPLTTGNIWKYRTKIDFEINIIDSLFPDSLVIDTTVYFDSTGTFFEYSELEILNKLDENGEKYLVVDRFYGRDETYTNLAGVDTLELSNEEDGLYQEYLEGYGREFSYPEFLRKMMLKRTRTKGKSRLLAYPLEGGLEWDESRYNSADMNRNTIIRKALKQKEIKVYGKNYFAWDIFVKNMGDSDESYTIKWHEFYSKEGFVKESSSYDDQPMTDEEGNVIGVFSLQLEKNLVEYDLK